MFLLVNLLSKEIVFLLSKLLTKKISFPTSNCHYVQLCDIFITLSSHSEIHAFLRGLPKKRNFSLLSAATSGYAPRSEAVGIPQAAGVM